MSDDHDDGLVLDDEEDLAGEVPRRLAEQPQLMEMTVEIEDEETDDRGFMAVKPWLGSVFAPTGFVASAELDTPPVERLVPQWIYGYRGDDVRDNVFVLPSGELLYHIAAYAIVFDPVKMTQRYFFGAGAHDDDIMCLALSPDKKLCATGQIGRRPWVCVWDVTSMRLVAKLQGALQHGISSVAFSADGRRVAAVGADGQNSMEIYDLAKKSVVAAGKCGTDRVLSIKFFPKDADRLVSCGAKKVQFYEVSGGSITARRGVFGRGNTQQTVLCGAWVDANSFATGTYSGAIYVWDGKTRSVKKSVEKAHRGQVYSIAANAQGVFTGGRDGTVKMWTRELAPVQSVTLPSPGPAPAVRALDATDTMVAAGTSLGSVLTLDAKSLAPTLRVQGHAGGELWGLAVHPSSNVAVTVGDEGLLAVWDLTSHVAVDMMSIGAAARAVAFDKSASKLAVGCEDGTVKLYSFPTLQLLQSVKLFSSGATDIKFSPNGDRVAVGSHDRNVEILSSNLSRIGTLSGHHDTITHFDWSADGRWLQTTSAGYELLFWDTEKMAQFTRPSDLANLEWDTWTCVLGFPVQGIFRGTMDGTDVNAVHQSSAKHLIVLGDDFGNVKLYRSPCVSSSAVAFDGLGHSAHVTNTRFTCDDRFVLSTGGRDCAVVQWEVVGLSKTAGKKATSLPAKVGAPGGRGGAAPAAASSSSSSGGGAAPSPSGGAAASRGAADSLAKFLHGLDLDKYASTFKEQEIDLATLPMLTETDLSQMGIPIGPRRKIMQAAATLGK